MLARVPEDDGGNGLLGLLADELDDHTAFVELLSFLLL